MSKPESPDDSLAALAADWMAEIRSGSEEAPVALKVTEMNFFAPPERQWEFLRVAVELAGNVDELFTIAAGPFEHLLGWHGKDYIDLVEQAAAADPKFAYMTTGAWQYLMPEDVWQRVQAIQAGAEAADWRPEGL